MKKKESSKKTKPTQDLFSNKSLQISSRNTDELVIALCGPVGSPLHKVGESIKNILQDKFNYVCEIIRLSSIIEDLGEPAPKTPKFDRANKLIEEGNKLRGRYGNSVLADMAIKNISYRREKDKKESGKEYYDSKRVCHVIDSIKNQEELEALKSVYRDMFYFIGVFSPKSVREESLVNQGMTLGEVHQLIDRDSGEEIKHGQTVRNTFPCADFFLRIESNIDKPLNQKLERFLDIIFGVEIFTPSANETAMYMASSAAGNSACLSRQVGAAVTDIKGEIISVGWNDVPKANGNLYQFSFDDKSGESDHRCMNKDGGICFNDSEKREIAEEITRVLVKEGLIQDNNEQKAIELILNSKIRTLIEFSRSIHAEMHAIIMASQMGGERIKKGKLFCTTYPCHSCARHIIVSGIKEVYYIEPYRKSLATKLHSDAITEKEIEKEKVRILIFDGVAPTRYQKLFKMKPNSRKNSEGRRCKIDRKNARPLYEVSLESLPALEAIIVNNLKEKELI